MQAFRILASETDGVRLPSDTMQDDHGLSIAVLPFDNVSGLQSRTISARGSQKIFSPISQDLTVIEHNSSFAYKGKATRVQDIRRDLPVNYGLERSVQKAGDRIRVTAQLIDAGSGGHVWAERYDRRADDLLRSWTTSPS